MKKIMITLILTVLLTATVASTATAQLVEIKPDIVIDAPDKISTALEPAGETKTVDVTIKFKLNISSQIGFLESFFAPDKRIGGAYIFGLNYFYLLKSKAKELPNAEIELSVLGVPDWCTASLEDNSVFVNISDETKEVQTKLHLSASSDAPAFDLEDIAIKAEFKNEEGWNIETLEVEKTIEIQADYIPLIEATMDNGSYYKISPINTTTIPLTVKNLGNGKTTVKLVVENKPANWNITIPEDITIDVDSSKQIKLEVEPYEEFENETITLKITPGYYDDSTLKGNTTEMKIVFENDGSQDENGGLPGFEFLFLLIAIGVIFVISKRRKQ